MSDAKIPPVPKFASFRPKPAPAVSKSSQRKDDEQPDKSDRTKRSVNKSKHHDDSRERPSHPKEKKSRHHDPRDRDLDPRGTARKPLPSPADLDSRVDELRLYKVDLKGDPANIAFGSVHRYGVPSFRRSGYGRILGMPRNQRIDLGSTTEQEIHLRNDDDRARPVRKWALKYKPSNEPRILRLIRPDAEDEDLGSHLDYIPLPTRKRKRDSGSPSSPNRESIDYRSIEGKAKASSRPVDSDLEYESDQVGQEREAGLESIEREIRLKNAKLSNQAKESPRDLQAWLELVDHQQDMVLLGRTYPSREPSTSERRTIADIRISIYTQALREIRAKQDRLQLISGLMNEGKHYWETKQIAKRWQETLTEYPDSVELWTKYLDFAQTNFVDFKYDSCRRIFRSCLEMLAKSQTTALVDSSCSALADIQVYVVLRLTSLVKEAGYHELAIALWQALLEYFIFRPVEGQEVENASGILDLFEEFWESEVSRVGEINAKGWDKFDTLQTPVPEPVTIKFRTIHPSLRVFYDFSVLEEEYMTALSLPGRSSDDTGDDDPFHLILFSDIQELLSLLPPHYPHDSLIQAFLCFWHLPPLSSQDRVTHQGWWQDSFLRDEAIKTKEREPPILSAQDEHESADGFSDCLNAFSGFPMKCHQMTTDSLFKDAFDREHRSTDIEFIRRALKQIASASTDDRVAEYYLAFELRYFPDSARKSANQLLKKRPTSLRLYNAYALIEARTGAIESSDRVFCIALGMTKSLPEEARRDQILLWHSWIWEALDRGEVRTAVHRVMSIGDVKLTAQPIPSSKTSEYSAAATLRVKNILRDGRDHSLSTAQHAALILYTSCHALLVYLLNDFDIDAAFAIHHGTSDLLSKRNLSTSPTAELNHQAEARLLAYHASQSHYFKPSLIRAELAQSVALFPNNTILLGVYAANEARFRIDDRVRTIMRDVVLSSRRIRGQAPSVVGWAFAIFSEMNRDEALGSTAHSVRATFEKAVESDCGRNSQAIWTSYVLFEARQHRPSQALSVQNKMGKVKGAEPEDRAKRVFFRGLTRLPWCKPYLMLAFSHLREMLTFQELRRVYNVLGEKELRVHVDLEEAFEEIAEARVGARTEVSGLILPDDGESDGD